MEPWPGLPALGRLLGLARSTAADAQPISARFRELLASELAAAAPGPRVVKVAGTNGKGSVCAMLEACLLRDGLQVGLFTSPHLRSPAERFRVNGREVLSAALEAHARDVERVVLGGSGAEAREVERVATGGGGAEAREVERVATGGGEARGEGAMPSFFEMLVLIAARLFREAAVDVVILEAGVGGRSDATSLIPGDLAAITGVALDHQDRLGATVEAIAADKVGVASDGSELVLAAGIPAAARGVIEAGAAARGIRIVAASPGGLRARFDGMEPARVAIDTGDGALEVRLPLLGEHQVENLATVVALARALHGRGVIRDLACLRGVEATRWAGRMDLRGPLHAGGPRVLLDVAHNEQGIAALAESVDRRVPRERRVLVYGASADKGYQACLRYVPGLGRGVHLVAGFHRAESTAALAAALPGGCVAGSHGDIGGALGALLGPDGGLNAEDVVVVTGSLYLVGAAMDWLSAARGKGGVGGNG